MTYYQTTIGDTLVTVHRHSTRWALFADTCDLCGSEELRLVMDADGLPKQIACTCGEVWELELVAELAQAA